MQLYLVVSSVGPLLLSLTETFAVKAALTPSFPLLELWPTPSLCGAHVALFLISCAPHFASPFAELLAKVTPGRTNQPDCPIRCCCRLKRVHARTHTHTHTAVKLFIYIRIRHASKPRSCKHNKAAQIGATGNPELPCYLIYREQTCTRNTAGSCVRVSRLCMCVSMCVCVCVSWHGEEGG